MYPGWNQNFMTYGGGYQATPLAQTFQEPVPKPPLRVKLTPRERGSYNIFISQADPDGHNRVEGPQAVEFFKRSGLPTDVLKTIWTIATPEGESYLDRERFYVAMRLIALAQEGKPVSEQSIYDDVQAGIPKFQSNVVVKDKWEVDSSDREKYLRSFKTLSGGKGFLDTNEAINAFRETGVKSDYLKKIWNLSDPEDSGEFRENQFIVAMHLASRVKTLSEPVPDELPASLKKVMSMKPNEPAKVLQPEPVDSLQEAFSIQQLTKYPNLPPAPAAFPGSSASGIPGFSSQFQTMPTIKINLDDGKNSMSSMSSMSSMNSMNSMNNLKGKQEEKKEEDELLLAELAPKAGLIESPPEKSEKNWASERKSLERKSIEGKVEIGSRKDEELSEQIERIEEKIQKKFREWRDIRAKLSLEREKGQMLQTKLQESNTKYLKELSQTILSILDE